MSIGSYLLLIFSFLFWLFRIAVCVCAQLGNVFVVAPTNLEFEVVGLFIMLPILLWLTKRKLIPAILYLGAILIFYIQDFISGISMLFSGQTLLTSQLYTFGFACFAIILGIMHLISCILVGMNLGTSKERKTDWFYKNEEYDRELDERSDKNNYKFM